jgi:GR25 family glycosyltransferase involved in LPS biosynthesis
MVINLDSRPERWARFQSALPHDWPFPVPERWPAYDETQPGHAPPTHWKQCQGAWGCLQSHAAILRTIETEQLDYVLVMEDDAVFCQDFTAQVQRFLARIPGDWGQLYLGGQHYHETKGLSRAVNDRVLRCFNVNRTHAYAVRADYAAFAYRFLTELRHNRHVDYLYGDIHEKNYWPVYAPRRWLVGQAEGKSDIAREAPGRDGLVKIESWWNTFQYIDEFGVKQTQR